MPRLDCTPSSPLSRLSGQGRLRPLTRRSAPALAVILLAALGCREDAEHLAPSRSEPRSGTAERAVASAAGRPNIVVIMTDDQFVESMRVMPQTRGLIGSAG